MESDLLDYFDFDYLSISSAPVLLLKLKNLAVAYHSFQYDLLSSDLFDVQPVS